MKLQKDKNSLSREQAMELYDDLERAMSSLLGTKKNRPTQSPPSSASVSPRARAAYHIKPPLSDDTSSAVSSVMAATKSIQGRQGAISFLVILGILKVAATCIEASGVFSVPVAAASLSQPQPSAQQMIVSGARSTEERQLLLALDDRRVELENRGKKLEQRERELERRDQESAARLTELREMTNALKLDRDKNEKKKSTQIEQLANVYGSMDPKEAANLIEQLDITIALGLLQKMPEKRIAQILALMTPERALAITRLLSGAHQTSKNG